MAGNKKTTRKKYVIHTKAELAEAKWLVKEGSYKSLAHYKENMARIGELFDEKEKEKKIRSVKLKHAA